MGKRALDQKIIDKIVQLRKTGHSLPEIRSITAKGNATVFKYCRDVEVLPEYREALRIKQGGSKKRSAQQWDNASLYAQSEFSSLERSHRLIILACLYWAEGRKADFDIINSDPELVRVFVECLREIGVTKDQLRISIRVYSDVSKSKATLFWKKLLKVSDSQIINVDILQGKKEGKLQYGMCRVRIVKGGYYFKQIMSLVHQIKKLT